MQRVRCTQATQGAAYTSPTASLACWDGYVNSAGDCTGTCGIGKYGTVTYNVRATIDSGYCYSCSASNCYECVGPGNNMCVTCNKGYYLNH